MDGGWRGNRQPPPPPCAKGGGNGGFGAPTCVMGTPAPPHANPANQQTAATWYAVDYAPAGHHANHMNANYHAASTVPSSSAYYHNSSGGGGGGGGGGDNNPYVQVSPVPGPPGKNQMGTILKALGRCGKKLEDTGRKAGGTAGNVWHHLKTGPSLTDAAMARLAQGTKVFAEGGSDKVFQQTFGVFPGEQLRKSFACYLSTSAGPVIGTLYISTARLAFCSDNLLCHTIAPGQQEWVYYKIVMQLDQVRALNPSASMSNPAEKYIQIVTLDNNEFWFMGFVSYDKALKHLREALQRCYA
ncbi:GEM-like protein 1 [Typha angustifolia]|uniref:GEM-like protein 1 n=1 Tax=Typha angustifolia TaxID=59011 RepID=UPI003C2FE78A